MTGSRAATSTAIGTLSRRILDRQTRRGVAELLRHVLQLGHERRRLLLPDGTPPLGSSCRHERASAAEPRVGAGPAPRRSGQYLELTRWSFAAPGAADFKFPTRPRLSGATGRQTSLFQALLGPRGTWPTVDVEWCRLVLAQFWHTRAVATGTEFLLTFTSGTFGARTRDDGPRDAAPSHRPSTA